MNDNDDAKYRRDLLQLLDSLRSLGLNQALDLPQIAVIGSQSAGKSSLIEALCKIKLPRSTGTCTRCPIECRSSYADHPWRAQVFLKFERDREDKSTLAEEIPFGDPLFDPDLIEDRIRQAQLAVLNPNVDPVVFLRGDPPPRAGLSFTKNCVVVKISGRELSDLSFVDLPGIIASTADEKNKGDIKLVQKLISSYMSKTSTINLIVITCEVDYETQAAGLLARRYDPSGERTIGVLTKPDRIEANQERLWIPMVSGNYNALHNGWFCVKQLGPTDREAGLTWEDARVQEVEYFETAPGWSAIAEEHKANLGSKQLALKLGQVLSKELQKRLPSFRIELDRLIRANDHDLSRLPEQCPEGPRELVLQLLRKFVKEAQRQLVEGDPGAAEDGVVQNIRKQYVRLGTQLQEAAPVFLPRARGGADDFDLPRPSFLPADEIWLASSPQGNEHTVEDVARDAEWARTREWPGHYPFEVILIYMRKVADLWTAPVETTFADAHYIFERRLLALIDSHFSAYNHGGLLDTVKETSLELLGKCKQGTSKALKDVLDQEWHPESSHEQQYLAYEEQFADYYRDYFDTSGGITKLSQALEAGDNQDLLDAVRLLQQFGLPEMKPGDWKRLYPMDKTQASVLRIISSVRAHYQIAYKRFADKVKDTVDQRFVRSFGNEIENVLCKNLGLSTETPEEFFANLTRESDDMVALRSELKLKADRLRAARVKLS